VTDYGTLLAELAIPRLVGSPNHEQVRESLKREIAARGFVAMEHRFTARPRRVALAQGMAAGVLLGLVPVLWIARPPEASGWRWPLALSALALVALWAGIQAARLGSRTASGVSLVAVRPQARVRAWLVAHYDSKGQRLSMATRLVSLAVGLAGLGGVVAVVAGAPWQGYSAWPAVAGPAVLLLVGSAAIAFAGVTNTSDGAVDNATGLVAVLATVDAQSGDLPVGLVFLDAEEYGLEGARALVRERANLLADTAIINFDGIDDGGAVIGLVHRPGRVTDAVVAALGAARRRRLPLLVDGLILGQAARECVTIMRGNWHTARIVHTARDTTQRLTLSGVRGVAAGVARALHAAFRSSASGSIGSGGATR